MGHYTTSLTIPINITLDEHAKTVTLQGKVRSITLRPNCIVEFKGLVTNFLVTNVYPNGVVMLDSDTSVPGWWPFSKLLRGGSIFADALNATGWICIK